MLTRRRWTQIALGGLAGAASLAALPKRAEAGKPPAPPPAPKTVPWPYTIRFLGTLGGDYSVAEAINNQGVVVGWAETSPYSPPWAPSMYQKWQEAFIWTAQNGMQNLNDFIAPADRLNWRLINANGINSSGQIVGEAGHRGANGALQNTAFRFTPATATTPAILEDLGTLGGDQSSGKGINDAGECCGTSTDAAGNSRGFIYTYDSTLGRWGMHSLGDLGATPIFGAFASRINSYQQMCGDVQLTAGWHGFKFVPPGPMQDLGVIGVNRLKGGFLDNSSHAIDLNDAGLIVGQTSTGSGTNHAFKYINSMIDLGTLGGSGSAATGVNDFGWIVGRSDLADGTTRLFLYAPDANNVWSMMSVEPAITNLPAGTGGTLAKNYYPRINDNGAICGTRHPASGLPTYEAFIISP